MISYYVKKLHLIHLPALSTKRRPLLRCRWQVHGSKFLSAEHQAGEGNSAGKAVKVWAENSLEKIQNISECCIFSPNLLYCLVYSQVFCHVTRKLRSKCTSSVSLQSKKDLLDTTELLLNFVSNSQQRERSLRNKLNFAVSL